MASNISNDFWERTTLRNRVLVTAMGFTASFAVHAVEPTEGEMLTKAIVSLTQAVQIAEKQEAGKTIGAEFDVENNKAVWEIKVLGSAGVKEYKIDASSGAVVKVEDEHIRGKLTNFLTGMNSGSSRRAPATPSLRRTL